jgi:hypothetical protein
MIVRTLRASLVGTVVTGNLRKWAEGSEFLLCMIGTTVTRIMAKAAIS